MEADDDGSVPLGWAFHAAMSAKARLWRVLTLAYRWLVASGPAPRTSLFDRREPTLDGRAAPSLAPQAGEDYDDEETDEDEERTAPAARAPRKKAGRRHGNRR